MGHLLEKINERKEYEWHKTTRLIILTINVSNISDVGFLVLKIWYYCFNNTRNYASREFMVI